MTFIAALSDIALKDLTFVIYGPPKVTHLSFDLYENLFQVPLPVGVRAHPTGRILPDLRCKYWTKSMSLEPNRFVTDIDPTLIQQIFNIPK